jgi:hypothetical protein
MADILDLKSEQAFKVLHPGEAYFPDLDTGAGRKRLEDIAEDLLRQYKVDLDKARAEFEVKEPAQFWSIRAALESFTWDRDRDEKRYQELVHAFLTDLGISVEREVRLGEGIIDLLSADGVGVEIKLGDVSAAGLVRQLRAYIRDDRVRALIAVTPQADDLPERLFGKRILGIPVRARAALAG